MNKFLPLVAIVLLLCGFKNEHKVRSLDANPFSSLRYLYGPTDTVQLTGNFIKSGDLSESSKYLLSIISKNSNCNFKKINYAIGFKIPGYKQTFYVPSKDVNFLKTVSEKGKAVEKITLSCVVYRFYYMDDTCNFFFIDKASISE